MPKITDFPLMGCGYSITLEDMKNLYWDLAEPFDPRTMAFDLAAWDCRIPKEQQEGIPRIYCSYLTSGPQLYFLTLEFSAVRFKDRRDMERGDWTKVDFFVLTRLVRVVNVQMAKDIKVESEADRKIRDKFIEVFGKGIGEKQMTYGIQEWLYD